MLILLQQFEPEALMNYEEIAFLQPEIFDPPINLSLDQRRKLIRLEAGSSKKSSWSAISSWYCWTSKPFSRLIPSILQRSISK
jgi:hypothetical protein